PPRRPQETRRQQYVTPAGQRFARPSVFSRGPIISAPMSQTHSAARSQVTLVLCTVLHTFTHAYGAMLVPLYLLITRDLHLGKVQFAALLVTVYGIVYATCSYGSGMLADRFDRRWLLGVGLVINAV